MITTKLMEFASAIIGFFLGLIPADWTPPAWFSGAAGAVQQFFNSATSVGVWIPIDFAFLCAFSIMSAYIGGGVVKMIRILWSALTGGGGSAG